MSLVIFVLLRLAPGDIVDILFSTGGYVNPSERVAIEKELGLDRPLWVQYVGWIPPVTYVSPWEHFPLHAIQFLLPALAVGYRSSALMMRITRSALLEVMREDYIRTARAKG